MRVYGGGSVTALAVYIRYPPHLRLCHENPFRVECEHCDDHGVLRVM
jgi:hypothetical protein